jgi:iduronate 2-sulfatase
VIFTSDHGWHLNNHGGLWGKVSLFQESARVPLIIVTPQMKPRGGDGGDGGGVAGTASPRTVEMLDFYPTLCELAGLPPPPTAKLDGVSLVPQLNDPQAARANDRPAYSVLRRGKIWGKAVYTEHLRYAEYGDDASAGVELYDVAADPHEFKNLATDPAHADTAKRMKSLLDAQIHLRDAVGADIPARD